MHFPLYSEQSFIAVVVAITNGEGIMRTCRVRYIPSSRLQHVIPLHVSHHHFLITIAYFIPSSQSTLSFSLLCNSKPLAATNFEEGGFEEESTFGPASFLTFAVSLGCLGWVCYPLQTSS